MKILSTLITVSVIATASYLYLSTNADGELNVNSSANIDQKANISAVDINSSPSRGSLETNNSSSIKEISEESVLESVLADEDKGNVELALELVEIFGEGQVIPLDEEAQERLFSRLLSGKQKQARQEYLNAEYDPSYDATWITDTQVKVIEKIDEHFTNGAYLNEYECDGEKCDLKISFGDNDVPQNAATGFMHSIRHSPAILNSGARRDIGLREIGKDENGESFVSYVIGELKTQKVSD